jgi:hypothetical protein
VLVFGTFLVATGLVLSIPLGAWFSLVYLTIRTCSVLAAAFAIWCLRPSLRFPAGILLAASYATFTAPRYMPIRYAAMAALIGAIAFAMMYFFERRRERRSGR